MSKIAVIAHAGKTFGGGLLELRRELERQGIEDPFWREVPKSKAAPREVKRALAEGAELIFVWGGDGTVQRCIDVVAGSDAALAILPAGTANLLATNLDIPQDIEQGVAIGLRGDRRKLDVGRFNGERFGVMAGAGFDASMIREADGGLKDRLGRVAYVWTGSKNLRASRSGRRSRSTAPRGTRALRAASSSATSDASSAASTSSRTRARTTDGSRSASSTPTGSRTGRARWRAPRSAKRTSRRSSAPRARRRSRSSSIARCSTKSTAVTA